MRALVAEVLDNAPLLATAFAIPQFLPQLFKLGRSGDVAGVSWSWATLTSISNAAWFVYFALSHFWTALAPSSSAALLAGALALMLARRRQARLRQAVAICAWTALLAGSFGFAGRTGLGTLLAASFVLQVIPSIWTAYRTSKPSGISRGTWLLIFAELFCWAAYGLHKADPRLIVLGCTGVTASALILARSLLSTRQDPDDSSARARARAIDILPNTYGPIHRSRLTVTQALAPDLAAYGIRVVAIVPGLIGQDGQPPESLELVAATAPLGRVGYPADIAAAVAFAASDDAAYITGTTIAVDGGLLSQQRSPQVETFPVTSFPPLPPKEEP
jgi:NAD(P)-dependent dehydrogenase (short-subunit alcohol dehydrogenase family)